MGIFVGARRWGVHYGGCVVAPTASCTQWAWKADNWKADNWKADNWKADNTTRNTAPGVQRPVAFATCRDIRSSYIRLTASAYLSALLASKQVL
jgi:hypothetical protein